MNACLGRSRDDGENEMRSSDDDGSKDENSDDDDETNEYDDGVAMEPQLNSSSSSCTRLRWNSFESVFVA